MHLQITMITAVISGCSNCNDNICFLTFLQHVDCEATGLHVVRKWFAVLDKFSKRQTWVYGENKVFFRRIIIRYQEAHILYEHCMPVLTSDCCCAYNWLRVCRRLQIILAMNNSNLITFTTTEVDQNNIFYHKYLSIWLEFYNMPVWHRRLSTAMNKNVVISEGYQYGILFHEILRFALIS